MKESSYKPQQIEKKWQQIWNEENAFVAKEDSSREKYYALIEFPYPSGEGLHVGHPRGYTALDIISRKRRMEGYNVLYPIGWDAFGLPAENYAIKHKIHPRQAVIKNIETFKKQLKELGISFDWSREVDTTDPNYYKWTQWMFLKFLEHGLAYKDKTFINWCTSCKIGLANEEVESGSCERCGGEIVKKEKEQWMLKMTAYADKLIEGLEETDYIDSVKSMQLNWIGKSKGAEIDFQITNSQEKLRVYTTRPDTIFGATCMVIAPEHPLITQRTSDIVNKEEIVKYQEEAKKKSEFERVELVKEKTGVEVKGVRAINPLTKKEIPIWISDYVMMGYGTGAIMVVPAHDSRDWEFAKKYGIEMVEVIKGGNIEQEAFTNIETGTLVNSDFLNGLSVVEAKKVITEHIENNKIGKATTKYRLQDWVFSRQRYWGEPIPVINCDKCGHVPVPEEQLPVTLPNVESYEPTDNGESPLANITEWVNTQCPKCGGNAKRETDTMPNWAGSSWYYLRYMDAKNNKKFADMENLKYWGKVDWYNGGMEHATRHLLYARFWHKFFYDIGELPHSEPFNKRTAHGMILGENGEKMSKSRGNVVNPDDIINNYGADTLRAYEMFIGAFDQTAVWSENGVKGCKRFLDRVFNLKDLITSCENYSEKLESKIHQTIKKVSEDYEKMKYNTAIAALMSLVNEFYDVNSVTKGEFKILLKLLNPVAPHITEELWQYVGERTRLYNSPWPIWDEEKTIENQIEIVVQINGKVKEKITIPTNISNEQIEEIVFSQEKVKELIEGKTVVKKIIVPGRLVNIVIK